MCLPACITERTTTRRTPTTRERAGSSPRTALTTRVDPARSESSSAKVALQPLGYVPYDGLVLPLISPDGKYLATQVGEAPEWEQMIGRPGSNVGVNCSIAIFRLDGATATPVDPPPRISEGTVLGWIAYEDGFQLLCPFGAVPGDVILRYGTWEQSHEGLPRPEALSLLGLQSPGSNESAELAYRLCASASRSPPGFDPSLNGAWLVFDASSACMTIVSGESRERLARHSIAGCWASARAGQAVLLTTNDGLFLQRLTSDARAVRAQEPVRLLREPYVPRATTDPERPFILLGPGPKDKPDMLQVIAMRLIEE
jgi:hypothetical protein